MLNKNISKRNLYIIFTSLFLLLISLFFCSCSSSKYQPELKKAEITSPDIIQNGVLKVGVDFENPPLAGESSKSSGIDIDVASAIADNLGLKVEFIDVGSSAQLALDNKQVDIVMGVPKSATSNEMWKSDEYLPTAAVLFSMDENALVPKKTDSVKISTQLATSSALVAQNLFGSSNIKLESSLAASFESLKKGDVKYVAADAVVGQYLALNSNIDAKMIACLNKVSGYSIGVLSSNTGLQTKINNIVNNLTKTGVFNIISNKWFGKSLNISSLKKVDGADNQADGNELNTSVANEISGNSKIG